MKPELGVVITRRQRPWRRFSSLVISAAAGAGAAELLYDVIPPHVTGWRVATDVVLAALAAGTVDTKLNPGLTPNQESPMPGNSEPNTV